MFFLIFLSYTGITTAAVNNWFKVCLFLISPKNPVLLLFVLFSIQSSKENGWLTATLDLLYFRTRFKENIFTSVMCER